eukprot:scaffold2111_cov130-Isochrysis_galbana.AAC.1
MPAAADLVSREQASRRLLDAGGIRNARNAERGRRSKPASVAGAADRIATMIVACIGSGRCLGRPGRLIWHAACRARPACCSCRVFRCTVAGHALSMSATATSRRWSRYPASASHWRASSSRPTPRPSGSGRVSSEGQRVAGCSRSGRAPRRQPASGGGTASRGARLGPRRGRSAAPRRPQPQRRMLRARLLRLQGTAARRNGCLEGSAAGASGTPLGKLVPRPPAPPLTRPSRASQPPEPHDFHARRCSSCRAGLSAAAAGALRVTLVDREPLALHCAMSTAQVCGLATAPVGAPAPPGAVHAMQCDWAHATEALAGQADLVLGSEVLYDPSTVSTLVSAAASLLHPHGGSLLLAEPAVGRAVGCRQKLDAQAVARGATVSAAPLPPAVAAGRAEPLLLIEVRFGVQAGSGGAAREGVDTEAAGMQA